MRVLVTGGAGYIGATTAHMLRALGHDVIVYDNLSRGNREAVPEGVLLILGDINDTRKLDDVLREYRPEALFHFAAFIAPEESMERPEAYFRNNFVATLTLLETMLANGIQKLIFSSTAAVYGEPRRIPIEETDALDPINVYGESKLLAERMLNWFGHAYGIRYASLRYFNAAGSDGRSVESHRPESHLIPLVLQAAAGIRNYVSIWGTDYPTPDGTCIRDFIHVSDIADAHVRTLEALRFHNRLVYNIGNGAGFSVREVIESARRITGRTIRVVEADRRPGDPSVLVASSEKIRRELGWNPRFPELDKIMSSAWQAMHTTKSGGHDGLSECELRCPQCC